MWKDTIVPTPELTGLAQGCALTHGGQIQALCRPGNVSLCRLGLAGTGVGKGRGSGTEKGRAGPWVCQPKGRGLMAGSHPRWLILMLNCLDSYY